MMLYVADESTDVANPRAFKSLALASLQKKKNKQTNTVHSLRPYVTLARPNLSV